MASRKHVARLLYMEGEEYHENNQRDVISKGKQTEHVDHAEIKSFTGDFRGDDQGEYYGEHAINHRRAYYGK